MSALTQKELGLCIVGAISAFLITIAGNYFWWLAVELNPTYTHIHGLFAAFAAFLLVVYLFVNMLKAEK